jgi:hypothetical protein
MERTLPLAAALATMALAPAAASAQSPPSTLYVGDPLTYLRQGRPATALTTAFQLNQPLGAGSQVTAQTAGGTVLASATPTVLGSSGLCYQAAFTLPNPVSTGGSVTIVLTTGAGQALAPNPELIRTLTVRQQRNVPATVGAGTC